MASKKTSKPAPSPKPTPTPAPAPAKSSVKPPKGFGTKSSVPATKPSDKTLPFPSGGSKAGGTPPIGSPLGQLGKQTNASGGFQSGSVAQSQRPDVGTDTPQKRSQAAPRRIPTATGRQDHEYTLERMAYDSPLVRRFVRRLALQHDLVNGFLNSTPSLDRALSKMFMSFGRDEEQDALLRQAVQLYIRGRRTSPSSEQDSGDSNVDADAAEARLRALTEESIIDLLQRQSSIDESIRASANDSIESLLNDARLLLGVLGREYIGQYYILRLQYDVHLTVDTDTLAGEVGDQYGRDLASLEQSGINFSDFIGNAYQTVLDIAAAFGVAVDELASELATGSYIGNQLAAETDPVRLFRLLMGHVEIRLNPNAEYISDDGIQSAGVTTPFESGTLIDFYRYGSYLVPDIFNMVHEFGHVLDFRSGGYGTQRITDEGIQGVYGNGLRTLAGLDRSGGLQPQHYCFDLNQTPDECQSVSGGVAFDPGEEWADSFLFWVYDQRRRANLSSPGGFDNSPEGTRRRNVMNEWMASATSIVYGHSMSNEFTHYAETTYGQPTNLPPTAGGSLRDMPNSSGVSMTNIPPGATAIQLGYTLDTFGQYWILVVYDGYVGWVSTNNYVQPSGIDLIQNSNNPTDELTGRVYNVSDPQPVQYDYSREEQDNTLEGQLTPTPHIFYGYNISVEPANQS